MERTEQHEPVTYVKADISEQAHRLIRMKAAEDDVSREEVVAGVIEEWAETKEDGT